MSRSHSHSNTGIPGVSFSWRRAVGLTRLESDISRKTGIPFTRAGRQRKIGRIVTHMFNTLFVLAIAAVAVAFALHPEWIRMAERLFHAG
ncbi:MAG TPA: hypothetical protein VG943_16185 [Caulobacterales bacterium]|nr:hypothetical protein [Caulobacterales bacterium]